MRRVLAALDWLPLFVPALLLFSLLAAGPARLVVTFT